MATSRPPYRPDRFRNEHGRVTLDLLPNELKYLKDLAEERNNWWGEGDPKRRAKDQSGEDIHYNGLKGEHTVAQYYGLEIDERAIESGDDGHDFIALVDGVRTKIDVKVTTYTPPWLQTMETNTSADMYIGCYVDGPTVQIFGYATCDELLNGEFANTTGKGHKNYKLNEDECNLPHQPEQIQSLY